LGHKVKYRFTLFTHFFWVMRRMSNELKEIYRAAGLLSHFFEKRVPRDLFRGHSPSDRKSGSPLLNPNRGFQRADGTRREPDVEVVERDGKTFVKGCRCIWGEFRGVSVFDQPVSRLRGFVWWKIKHGAPVPEALAITQDGRETIGNHYTIAPKDDMEFGLFLVWLGQLAEHAVKI
jgi:hypothetical protein